MDLDTATPCQQNAVMSLEKIQFSLTAPRRVTNGSGVKNEFPTNCISSVETTMNFVSRLVFGLALLVWLGCGCSTVQTKVATGADKRAWSHVKLLVRTGHAHLDVVVYELAYNEFSDLIPLSEGDPYDAFLEVSFASTGQDIFFGSQTTTVNSQSSATGWYAGTGYVRGNYWEHRGTLAIEQTGTAVASTVASGGTLTYQNSTMIMALKDANGKRVWFADYNYKGGWEFSGWTVNTPDEAARLCLKRLAKRFAADFK